MSDEKILAGPKPGAEGPNPRNLLVPVLGVVGVIVVVVAFVVFRSKTPTPTSTLPSAPEASTQIPASPPEASPAARPTEANTGSPDTGSPAAHAGAHAAAPAAHAAHAASGQGRTAAAPHHAHPASSHAVAANRDVPSKRVVLSDLNLATQAGACTALKRIKRAADDVCPAQDWPLHNWHVRQECMQDAINRAVRATHSARLKAVSEKRDGC